MPKIYVIIKDTDSLLVGIGGKSGNPPVKRPGYHLPGGSIKKKEPPAETAIRELEEETGCDSTTARNLIQGSKVFDSKFSVPYNGQMVMVTVKFAVATVPKVADLVTQFKRPKITNVNDEPFENLLAIPLADCWNDVNFKYPVTDWFGAGLLQASKFKLI